VVVTVKKDTITMINPLELLQYGFIARGLLAGVLVAVIAPVIGVFLVLRRYSLIADTLAHVSLAGVAIGLIAGINPLLTALGAAVIGAVGLERIRTRGKIYAESALAVFLSGSLAVAVVLLSLAKGFSTSLFSFLFGSISTVSAPDIVLIVGIAVVVLSVVGLSFSRLVFIAFDEKAAQVSGIKVEWWNTLFMILAAAVIATAIPIVGVLLVSALVVIPVLIALQLQQSMVRTIGIAQVVAVLAVVLGFFSSYYFDIAPGGTIVLLLVATFFVTQKWFEKR